MAKKCTICSDPATHRIKDTSEFYCKDCALEYFDDITVLQEIVDDAKKLKKLVEKHIGSEEDD